MRWLRDFHDRPMPAPIVDRDPGDETWQIRMSGYNVMYDPPPWTCRVCWMFNGAREFFLTKKPGCCAYCNSEP